MKTAFEEIGRINVSFTADSGESGQVCKMADNGKVAPCADGEAFIGVMEFVRKGVAGVRLHGFAEVSYTGTAPALGYVNLVADGAGGVKTGTGGKTCLVVSVDKNNMKAIIEL